MKIAILSGNPKADGLCQSVTQMAKQGALEGGAEVEEIRLCESTFKRCLVCGEGWGICREQGICTYGSDGFDEIVERLKSCDAVVIATPVYWSETSEALKSFLDRLRRIEFGKAEVMKNKQVLLIASAGGSGNGLLSSFEQLERFCKHIGAPIFDFIGVNRWNSDYKRLAAKSAAFAMAGGRKNGETV